MEKRLKMGHLAMLVASVFWGLMAPVSKFAMQGGHMSSVALADLRVIGACSLFWIYSLFHKSEKVDRKDYLKLAGASLFAIVFNQCLFLYGLGTTSPVNASIITTTMPIWTMILAALILKEPVTGKKAGGVLLGTCGALILVCGDMILRGSISSTGNSNLGGDIACFVAQCSYALYLVLFRDIIIKYSPVTLMKWMFTFAALFMLPFTGAELFRTDWAGLESYQFLSAAYVVLFGTFFCYLIVPVGQKVLRPTVVAIYNYVQPVVATTVAIIAGMDTFNYLKIIAVILIFLAVTLVNRSRAKGDPIKK